MQNYASFSLECVKVPMSAHQVLPLTAYIFEATYSTAATQANKIQNMDQSESLNQWAGIGALTYCCENCQVNCEHS